MQKLLALQASAGSGKTFALTVRYICLLFLGASPSSIVALTFTKKAANEMKHRIYETLLHLGEEEKKAELKSICEVLQKSEDEILQIRTNVLEGFLVSRLHVETIDAFFGKILRKFSLYLGIMPDFKTVENEKSEKFEELFIKEVKADKQLFSSLITFMINEQRKLSSLFDIFAYLYENSSKIKKEYPRTQFYPSESEILENAKKIALYLQENDAPKRTYGAFLQEDLNGLLTRSFWQYESLINRTYKKYHSPKLDELYGKLKRSYKEFIDAKQSYLLGEFFTLFKHYKKIKFSLAKSENELTFNDVTLFTHELLHQRITNDFLYFRLDGEISHLLIDEFQDTNAMQFEILKPIVEEIASGIGIKEDRSFFYVGDVKQSIYRFRGGTKELFGAVAKKYNVNIEDLDVNYRSSEKVVEFVNRIFGEIFPHYVKQKIFVSAKDKGFVEVKSTDDLLQCVVNSIEQLMQEGVSEDDIAILCHANKDAQEIKSRINEHNKNLQVSVESTVKLIHSRSIKLILEFLKFSYFGFEINGKNALVLQGGNFEEKFDVKITNFNRSVEQIVYECLQILHINPRDKDVLRFVEVAKNYDDIEDMLFNIDRIDEPSLSTQIHGIKILTIHKSKGLEYQSVIVVDRLKKEAYDRSTFLFDGDDIYYKMKNRQYVDAKYKEAKERDDKQIEDDKKNLYYVAFTRAVDNLVVIQKDSSSSFKNLQLVEFQEGKISASIQKERAKSIHEFAPPRHYGTQKGVEPSEKKDPNPQGIHFGLALHYLLELCSEFTKEALEQTYVMLENRFGSLVDTKKILTRGINLIKNETFQGLLQGATYKKEQPFIINGQRKQIDLLIEKSDKLIIVDYKTSNHPLKEHEMQVKEYKNGLLKMQDKPVEAWLVYIKEYDVEAILVK